jgi:transposase-like protein
MPLNLPYKILKQEETDHDIFFHLETIDKPSACLLCNSPDIRKKDKLKNFYFDIHVRDKRVGLTIHAQRYLCKSCKKSFKEVATDKKPN